MLAFTEAGTRSDVAHSEPFVLPVLGTTRGRCGAPGARAAWIVALAVNSGRGLSSLFLCMIGWQGDPAPNGLSQRHVLCVQSFLCRTFELANLANEVPEVWRSRRNRRFPDEERYGATELEEAGCEQRAGQPFRS